MIIDKFAEVKINVSNRDYFRSIGFQNLKIKQKISVPIEKLMKFSKSEIRVKCDDCGGENIIQFCNYKEPYYCKKCFMSHSIDKMKKTKLEKYGNPSYVNPEKMIKTKLEKYGTLDMSEKIKKSVKDKYDVENVFQLENVKQKIKDFNLEKYGVEYVSQRSEIKRKKEKTFNEKFGGVLMGSDVLKNKIKDSNLERYGVEYISQSVEIKRKKEKTFNDKFGGFLMGSDILKDKIEKTNLEKYGHVNYFSTNEFKLSQGILLDEEMIDKWKLYKRKSRRLFNKIKNTILQNWDGFDYYDNQYIKENLNLNYYDGDYPTIDHKLSVFYGFMNDIPVEEINKIENLVVTKRCLNSSKGK